jgi:hypothetical protein
MMISYPYVSPVEGMIELGLAAEAGQLVPRTKDYHSQNGWYGGNYCYPK